MSGIRYERCPVRGCPDHGPHSETEVCNDCGGCVARHCVCASEPGAVVGGGMNMLRQLLPPGSGPADFEAALMVIGRWRLLQDDEADTPAGR